MKDFTLLTSILLITCCLFVSSASAADYLGSMKIEANNSCGVKDIPIRVIDSNGKPLLGAKVTVICRNKKTDSGSTDSKGIFIYKGVNTKTGLNEITAKKDNYGDGTLNINISTQCVPDTTTTVISTTSTTEETTTSTRTTTTTTIPCNRNGVCEPLSRENFSICPKDCSGAKDGICDKQPDGICDPDCGRGDDVDCFCNRNGVCEPPFENYDSCQSDCMKFVKDGFCDNSTNNICDLDCASGDSDCKGSDLGSLILPLGLIIVVFGVIVGLNLRRASKKMDDEKRRDELIVSLKERLKNGEDPEVLKNELACSGKDVKLLELAEKRLWE